MDIATVLFVSLVVLIYGAFSNFLRNTVLTAPLVFTALGVTCGSLGFGIFSVELDNRVILALAELTLIIVLFTDAARIDLKLLYREHNLPVRLLAIGLPGTIVLGALVGWVLFPSLGFFGAAVLATVVAPTDAALAHAVVTRKIVPTRIRQAISVESGLNDGLALPLLLIFLCYAESMSHVETTGYWIRFAAKQITLGPVVGILAGVVGGVFLEKAKKRMFIGHTFFQLSALALALLAYSAAESVGGNGFIAAFVAGIVVGKVSPAIGETLFDFGESEGQLLSYAVFFVFGAILIPEALANSFSLKVVLFPVLSLTIIRFVPAFGSLVGTGLRSSSRAFISWFGPRGIASIVFVLVILEKASFQGLDLVVQAAVFTIFLSIVFHGISASPLSQWYAMHLRNNYDLDDLADGEHREISEFPFFRGHRRGD